MLITISKSNQWQKIQRINVILSKTVYRRLIGVCWHKSEYTKSKL